MPPLSNSICPNECKGIETSSNGSHPLSKRDINLNPFHYLTLPLKSNWGKVGPFLDNYNKYARVAFVLLGGIGVIAMLDGHNWKLPRWPWAKDGRNNPPPSFTHQNEMYTVDQVAEMKLMDILKEMSMDELEGNAWKDLPEGEDKTMKEAEEQFMGDTQEGVADILEETMDMGTQY
jgi:hypothetical protein